MKNLCKFFAAGIFAVIAIVSDARAEAGIYDDAIDALATEVRALSYDFNRQDIAADEINSEIAVLSQSLEGLLGTITADKALSQNYLTDCQAWFEQLHNVLEKLESAAAA